MSLLKQISKSSYNCQTPECFKNKRERGLWGPVLPKKGSGERLASWLIRKNLVIMVETVDCYFPKGEPQATMESV